MDYGMDHYAAVTFSNAPQDRIISMAWASNWMYAKDLPLKGWRCMMTVPRELFLMEYNGSLVMGSMPVSEIMEKCAADIQHYTLSETSPTLNIDGLLINLDNNIMTVDRKSDLKFSNHFNVETSAVLDNRSEHDVMVLRDENMVELFVDGGAVAMTFLIF
jgi:sucrose-6-phosphate hydrolase SacC (GH32 family)